MGRSSASYRTTLNQGGFKVNKPRTARAWWAGAAAESACSRRSASCPRSRANWSAASAMRVTCSRAVTSAALDRTRCGPSAPAAAVSNSRTYSITILISYGQGPDASMPLFSQVHDEVRLEGQAP